MANNNQEGNQGANNKGGNTGGENKRGFAAMDEGRRREIASMGGRAAHESGNAHQFDSEEAREAGRKGGQASRGGGEKGDSEGSSER